MKNFLIALLACLFPTVAMAQQPEGEWEPWFWFGNTGQPSAIVAVHLVHVYDHFTDTGKAVAIPPDYNCPNSQLGSPLSRLWTFPTNGSPGPGSFEDAPLCSTYMYCGGHSALADGRVLFVGGMISQAFAWGFGPRQSVLSPGPAGRPLEHRTDSTQHELRTLVPHRHHAGAPNSIA